MSFFVVVPISKELETSFFFLRHFGLVAVFTNHNVKLTACAPYAGSSRHAHVTFQSRTVVVQWQNP